MPSLVTRKLIQRRTSKRGSASTPSVGVQGLFEGNRSDALLLYDACSSANGAVTREFRSGGSVTELISACGVHDTAPGVGDNSFTSALIKTLREDSSPMFVSQLYQRILARLTYTPDRKDKRIPVHCTLTSEKGGRQIVLAPFAPAKLPVLRSADPGPCDRFMIALKVSEKVHDRGELDNEEWKEWLLMAPASVLEVDLLKP